MVLIGICVVYAFYRIFLSLVEINFVKSKMNEKAVILSKDDYVNAAKTAIINQKFDIFGEIYGFFINAFWLICGLNLLSSLVNLQNEIYQSLFLVAFVFLGFVLNLPLEIYRVFIKDKKLGFSNMTISLFIKDIIKSGLMLIIFNFILIYLVLLCFKIGEIWWILAFVVSFAFVLILQLIYPTIIVPLFNKVKPLDDENLKDAINKLLQKCGFKSSGVFVLDASKRDKRLNAYFGGLGSTKRVVLFDTLIQKLSKAEILAVLGHELGHFRHKDIIKMITMFAIMLFAMFFIFSHLPNWFLNELGIKNTNVAIIVSFLIFSPVAMAFFEPLISKLSRNNEFNADHFGANNSTNADMISALIKLGTENKAFPLSHPIYSAIYHSHPTLYERINELKSENC